MAVGKNFYVAQKGPLSRVTPPHLRHPGRKTRDPRASGTVRRDLQRVPGRVDSRLRGNDKKSRHPGRRPGIYCQYSSVLTQSAPLPWLESLPIPGGLPYPCNLLYGRPNQRSLLGLRVPPRIVFQKS